MEPRYFFLSLFLSVATLSSAQTLVRFAVDMNGVTEFNPATDTLRVAGDFQSWNPRDPSGANILTDADGNGVYRVDITTTSTSLQFKYVINTWDPEGANEFSGATPGNPGNCVQNNNRVANVSGDTYELPIYIYNSCDVSTIVSTQERVFESEFNIQPNPVTNESLVTFAQQQSSAQLLILLNTVGELVFQTEIPAGNSNYLLNRGDYPAGLYFLQLLASDGSRTTKRVFFQ